MTAIEVPVNLSHQVAHGLHLCQQFVDNLSSTCGLKDAACHEAEGVDKLATELVVSHEVEHQAHYLTIPVRLVVHSAGILEADEIGEGVVCIIVLVLIEIAQAKGIVEIEADKAVAPIETAAVALDIIVGPVVIAEEHGGGHVVDELVDVEQRLQLFVGAFGIDLSAQLEDAVESDVIAVLYLKVLEGVELLVVIAPVGIGEIVVVGLAEIQHTTQLTVDILDNGYIALHVDIDA